MVGGGAAGDGPVGGPVAVDVGADAGGAGLAVFAPEARGRLGVDEAVGVDYGENVVVVFVDEGFDGGAVGVVVEESVGRVFADHGGDPFARVYGAVEDGGGFGAAAGTAEDVDPGYWAAFVRGAGADDLGVGGEAGLELGEEGEMFGVGVVGVEPGVVGGEDRLRGVS